MQDCRCGGRGGIRTHERVAPLPVFKTGALNRSATHPRTERFVARSRGQPTIHRRPAYTDSPAGRRVPSLRTRPATGVEIHGIVQGRKSWSGKLDMSGVLITTWPTLAT